MTLADEDGEHDMRDVDAMAPGWRSGRSAPGSMAT